LNFEYKDWKDNLEGRKLEVRVLMHNALMRQTRRSAGLPQNPAAAPEIENQWYILFIYLFFV